MPFYRARNTASPAKQLPTPGGLDPSDAISPGSFRSYAAHPPENRGSYFPYLSPGSSGSRSPEPSESMTASLIPNTKLLRSQSSGRSSVNSSPYLTAPESAEDTDAPPYKSKKKLSRSLTMVTRTSKTTSRKSKKVKCNEQIHRDDFASTSSKAQEYPFRKESLSSEAASQTSHKCVTPRRSQTHAIKRDDILRSLYSCPAPPVETRRWSSVELGAKPHIPSHNNRDSFAYDSSRRCSTFNLPNDATDENLVETVRSRLTNRKVPMVPLETPATITLRKASGASSISGNIISPPIRSPRSPAPSGDSNPKVWQSQDQRRPSAYLITAAEIDSITQLIERNLKESKSRQQTIGNSANSHFQLGNPFHKPSIRNGSISLSRPAPAEVAVTFADTHTEYSSPKYSSSGENTPNTRRKSSDLSVSKIISASSVHQIIWEEDTKRPTLQSVKSTRTVDSFRYERTHSTYDQSSPSGFNPGPSWKTKISAEGPLKDHLHPLASPMVETTFEWSESKPAEDDSWQPQMISIYSDADQKRKAQTAPTDEDSRSENSISQRASRNSKGKGVSRHSIHKKQDPTQNPFISAVTKQLDVISFPALPMRQKTSDWISPLPDISAPASAPASTPASESTPIAPTSNSRTTLYDRGLDITQGPPVIRRASDEQRSARSSGVDSEQRLKLYTKLDNLNHQRHKYVDYEPRKKSVVLEHPALKMSRKDSLKFDIGGAIGISSGKRKSVGNLLKLDIGVTNESERFRSDSIVNALFGKRSEAGSRRRNLSEHHGEEPSVSISAQFGDGSSMDHPSKQTRNIKSQSRLQQEMASSSKNVVKSIRSSTLPHHTLNFCPTSPHHSPSTTSKKNKQPLYTTIPRQTKSSYITKTPGSSSEHLNLVEKKSSASLLEDTMGIYITMTGARRSDDLYDEGLGGEGASLCSLGCESHNCAGDESSIS